jgi:hypothetical protein
MQAKRHAKVVKRRKAAPQRKPAAAKKPFDWRQMLNPNKLNRHDLEDKCHVMATDLFTVIESSVGSELAKEIYAFVAADTVDPSNLSFDWRSFKPTDYVAKEEPSDHGRHRRP